MVDPMTRWHVISLALMILSAAIVTGAFYLLLSLFLALREYTPS